jgi:stage II sporulation protein M
MKSVVFSFKKPEKHTSLRRKVSLSDIRYLFKRYGLKIFFVALLLTGLGMGAVYARNADIELLNSLDFLFTTNLDARLNQNAAGTFCACFASDFIFLFTVFLLGFAPWGIPFILLAMFFKGFGTGLTAGYLFVTYSFKGAGFYLLILLPGTFLFCIALITISSFAFEFSTKLFSTILGKNTPTVPMRASTISFSSHFMSALIMTFCAALIDTALWTLFSGAFSILA